MKGPDFELKKLRGYIFDSETMEKLGFDRVKEDDFDRDHLNRFLEVANLGQYKKILGKNKIKNKNKHSQAEKEFGIKEILALLESNTVLEDLSEIIERKDIYKLGACKYNFFV